MALSRSPVRRPRHLLAGVLRGVLPSFVVDTAWPEHASPLIGQQDQLPYQQPCQQPYQKQETQLHPTAYLDGLRGIASFVVFVCHYTELHHGYLTPMYGFGGDHGSRDSVLQLPFVRAVYAGRPMVHIFFVISGFVLSYKPLRLLHSGGALEKCYTALASAVFRRPMRLYLPCLVSTLMIAVLMQTGCLYAPAASWPAQLGSWAHAYARAITWPWAWDHHMMPAYDIHLWTIPIEFAHSMLLFMVLLGLARLRTRVRQAATLALIAYAAWCGKWAAIEFLAGLFLAEVHVLRAASPSKTKPKPQPKTRGWLHTALHSAVLAACLFVSGWPNDGDEAQQTPGIGYLYAQTPRAFIANGDGDGNWIVQIFWFTWSGILAVWSVGELGPVRGLFEGGVAQYCGKISYAIYIMHGPGLELFQDRVLGRAAQAAQGTVGAEGFVAGGAGRGVRGLIGIDTATQRTMSWFVGLVVLGMINVWMADLFWRFVDVPIVKLGRTVEELCIAPSPPPPSSSGGALLPEGASYATSKERE